MMKKKAKMSLKLDDSDDGEGAEGAKFERRKKGHHQPTNNNGEGSGGGGGGFTINKAYANRYNEWRQKEETQKLKDRYGDVNLAALGDSYDDDESSETEDDDAEEWDPETEKEFLITMSRLKGKDPRIYDGKVKFFTEKSSTGGGGVVVVADDDNDVVELKKKKSKKDDAPMFLKDYDRKLITEKGGKDDESDSDENEDRNRERERRQASPTYAQQQEALKADLAKFVADDKKSSDSDEEKEEGGLFKKRKKTDAQQRREDDEYLEWLKGKKTALNNAEDAEELSSLRKYWADPKLDKGERFLKDYILNRKYKVADNEELPSYNDIVNGNGADNDEGEEEDDIDAEEAELERQETFENKYNFRFEEPDPEFIKSYPRTIKDGLRRGDDRRKEQRQAHLERKKREKEEAKQEIRELKAFKRKEIGEKIGKLMEIIGGDEEVKFNPADLDGDFNPEEYDRKMQELFNSEYYDAPEEELKPGWAEEDDEDSDRVPFEEDSDADDEANTPSTSVEGKSKKEKASTKPLKEALNKPKPVFDPNQKTFAEYLDEYYKLDADSFAGGSKTRFRYRQVEANDFGLSTHEILDADDKELNSWVSVKKMTQYRSDREEMYDKEAYRKKAQDFNKKIRLLASVFEQRNKDSDSSSDDDNDNLKGSSSSATQLKGIQEKSDSSIPTSSTTPSQAVIPTHPSTSDNTNNKSKKRRQKKKKTPAAPSSNIPSAPPPVSTNANDKNNPPKTTVGPPAKKSPKKSAAEPSAKNNPDHPVATNKKSSMAYEKGRQAMGKQIGDGGLKKGNRKRKKSTSTSGGNPPNNNKNIKRAAIITPSDDRLKAYGINPKKFKNKLKYKQQS